MSVSLPHGIPPQAFTPHLRVRSYEASRDGRVRPSTILRYFEQIATEASAFAGFDPAWYLRHGAAWVVREMDLLLGTLPTVGDELLLATWVADFRRVQSRRDYALWRADCSRPIARAEARWAYVERVRGQPLRISEEISTALAPLGHLMHTRQLALLPPPDHPEHTFSLTARDYEADSQQHINNCVYADWLGEGLVQTLQARRAELAEALSPRYYAIAYLRAALPGDTLRVETQLAPRGSRGYLATQRVVDVATGAPYVLSHSLHLRTHAVVSVAPNPTHPTSPSRFFTKSRD